MPALRLAPRCSWTACPRTITCDVRPASFCFVLIYQQPDKVDQNGNEIEWPVPYWFMDIGCAVMIALLAAIDEGLVAAFAGSKDLKTFRSILNIPDEVTPVGVIAVGYRAPDVPSPSLKRGRKSDAEYVHYEDW